MLNDNQSVYEALFITAKKLKQPKCLLTDKWRNKMWITIQWAIIIQQ